MNPRYLLMTTDETTDWLIKILMGWIDRLETERARQYDIITVAGVQKRLHNDTDGYWARKADKANAQIVKITSAIGFMEQAIAHAADNPLDYDQLNALRLACWDVRNAAQQVPSHYAPANWRELVGWPDDKPPASE